MKDGGPGQSALKCNVFNNYAACTEPEFLNISWGLKRQLLP